MPQEHVLLVALGGGGDVIAAVLLAERFSRQGWKPVIASLAWERLAKDPLPGPRCPTELSQIHLLTEYLGEVTSQTAFPNGALTNQALLHHWLGVENNFILDPMGGVKSLAKGLQWLETKFRFQQVWGIDVGGDILAEKPIPSLRSPLADALVLSALYQVYPKAQVAVMGLGADGELPREVWRPQIKQHHAQGIICKQFTLSLNSINQIANLLDQRILSSEATALVVRAYQGMTGNVLVRDAGSIIQADSQLLPGFVYQAQTIYDQINELPQALQSSQSIEQASSIVENLGYTSEWRVEYEKSHRPQGLYPSQERATLLPRVYKLLSQIKQRPEGIDFVAERYLTEQLNADLGCVQSAVDQLALEHHVMLYPPFIALRRSAP